MRALDERPPFIEQDESRVTYAHKIEAADRALDPPHGGRARADVRALRPHIGARIALPSGDFLGVVAARVAESRPEPGRVPRATATGCCSARGRRARADRDPPARRPPDGRRRLAARPARPSLTDFAV